MKKLRFHLGIRLIVYGIAILVIGGIFTLFKFDLKRVFFGLDVFSTKLFLLPFAMIIAGAIMLWWPNR
ncbi:MAG: hypothetical protein AABX51_01655 [Nanoarchaeota archaeon]